MAAIVSTPLAPFTTLGVGGRANLLTLEDPESFPDVAVAISDLAVPPVCLGWGSNVLASDEGVAAPVLLMRTQGIAVADDSAAGGVKVTVQAGHALPDLIEFATGEGFVGVETLAGVPGTVGAMPIQNVGAYGQETADTLTEITAWDWQTRQLTTLSAADCSFGHRTSLFKHSHRWTVLTVTLRLRRDRLGAPILYSELARHLDVPLGTRLPTRDINEAVIAVRRAKGMVLDPTDHDSRSVGSIFLSPVITAHQAATLRVMGASPHSYPDGTTRVGASWLIRQAGYSLGQRLATGVRISTKHFTLVADDGATGAAFADAATAIRARVHNATGVTLDFEPDTLGRSPNFELLMAR